ncbi:MAG: ABC transporter ATP-binding protein [Anaerolineales bacterium]|jgi:iron complex transport system ATP-binding protein
MSGLRFDRATFGYGNRAVLKDVSLTIQPGEVVAVVGPNGVGKSTLVKAASGVLPLMAGRVSVSGESLQKMAPALRARRVAVVPQAIQLPPAFLSVDVVLTGRTPYLGWLQREGERDHQIARRVMQRTHTLEQANRPVGELSGGEQQRVLIARALTQQAQVMLLDEPTAHLDLQHQNNILTLVRDLAEKDDLAVLLTLHDLNLVARFADRVALLSNGRLRKVGLPSEVLTPEELAPVYGITIHVVPHPIYGTPLVLS